jgi:8-oxo-dGTP pyrophosphatase MutT (NUDIX family)
VETFKKGAKMMQSPVKTHNAAGIVPYIVDGDGLKFLLVKSSLGWEFPKGHIEDGESSLVAAKRETKEETGLVINQIHPSFEYVSKYFLTKNYSTGEKLLVPEPKTVTYFLGKSPTKRVKLSFEHNGYGWFTSTEANKKLKFSGKRRVLRHAENALSEIL